MTGKQTDRRGRAMPAPADRTARAHAGAAAAHAPASLIRRIERVKDQLTADDRARLRQLVAPDAHADVYAEGIRAGARMAMERVQRAIAGFGEGE